MATGHTDYTTANLAAYVSHMSVKRKVKALWDTSGHQFLRALRKGRHWNKGGTVKDNDLILPIQFSDLTAPVDGTAKASMLTPLTFRANVGDTQVKYIFSYYNGQF